MPFEIIRNDITRMSVDAIVNTANPRPVIGSGVDAAIHAKAGPSLLMARKKIGLMNTGEACVTPGFNLPSKYVIHTVGPVWEDGAHGEAYLLRSCYIHSLKLAVYHQCSSVAFPLISSGNYGFPKKLALQIAVKAIRDFLKDHELQVYLVVFSKEALELPEGLVEKIRSFIDDAYVQKREKAEYSFSVSRNFDFVRERLEASEENREESEIFRVRREHPPASAATEEIPAMDWASESTLESCENGERQIPEPLPFRSTKVSALEEQEDMASTGPIPQIREAKFRPEPREASRPAKRSVGPGRLFSTKPSKKPAIPLFDEKELQQLVQKADAGFSETLLNLIDKSGEKDSDIYKRANVDRKLFSKIRNNPQYKPSKATAVAFAIALELDLEETRDFIGRAGYALSRSNKFDIIIEYFITHERYDIYEINLMLFEFDQSLLGA